VVEKAWNWQVGKTWDLAGWKRGSAVFRTSGGLGGVLKGRLGVPGMENWWSSLVVF